MDNNIINNNEEYNKIILRYNKILEFKNDNFINLNDNINNFYDKINILYKNINKIIIKKNNNNNNNFNNIFLNLFKILFLFRLDDIKILNLQNYIEKFLNVINNSKKDILIDEINKFINNNNNNINFNNLSNYDYKCNTSPYMYYSINDDENLQQYFEIINKTGGLGQYNEIFNIIKNKNNSDITDEEINKFKNNINNLYIFISKINDKQFLNKEFLNKDIFKNKDFNNFKKHLDACISSINEFYNLIENNNNLKKILSSKFQKYYNIIYIKIKIINNLDNENKYINLDILIKDYKTIIYSLMNEIKNIILNNKTDLKNNIKIGIITSFYTFLTSYSLFKKFINDNKKIIYNNNNNNKTILIILLYDYLNRFVFNNKTIDFYKYNFDENKNKNEIILEIKLDNNTINNILYYNFNIDDFNKYIIKNKYININKLLNNNNIDNNIDIINNINNYILTFYDYKYNDILNFYNSNIYDNIIELLKDLKNQIRINKFIHHNNKKTDIFTIIQNLNFSSIYDEFKDKINSNEPKYIFYKINEIDIDNYNYRYDNKYDNDIVNNEIYIYNTKNINLLFEIVIRSQKAVKDYNIFNIYNKILKICDCIDNNINKNNIKKNILKNTINNDLTKINSYMNNILLKNINDVNKLKNLLYDIQINENKNEDNNVLFNKTAEELFYIKKQELTKYKLL